MNRPGGVLLPLLLVALGMVLLLNNLGIVGCEVWSQLWRLWPVLLIAAGVDLILGRSSLRWWLGAAILLVVLGGATLAVLDVSLPGERREVEQGLEGASTAQVGLGCRACTLTLTAGPDRTVLAAGQVELGWNDDLRQSFDVRDGVAHLVVQAERKHPVPSVGAGSGRNWRLALAPDVPLSLTVRAGMGDAELDLRGLALERLELESGLGEVVVWLPAAGRYDARIHGGVGEVTVYAPPELAVRLQAETGVGKVEVPVDFVREGDVYTSPNWAAAAAGVELTVERGVGEIILRRPTSL
ncbi:MAG: LiaF transmembrane domain-containing protein [Candidatus Bipolaricaulaceae bacterium]